MAEQPPLLDSTGRDPLVFYLFDVDGTLTEVRKVGTDILFLLYTTSPVCVLATSLVSNALHHINSEKFLRKTAMARVLDIPQVRPKAEVQC